MSDTQGIAGGIGLGFMLGMIVMIAVHCGDPGAGALRGACYPNATCNAGLSCMSKVCVETPTEEQTK